MSLLLFLWHWLLASFAMFWVVLWSLMLGFLASAMIQAEHRDEHKAAEPFRDDERPAHQPPQHQAQLDHPTRPSGNLLNFIIFGAGVLGLLWWAKRAPSLHSH